MCWLRSCTAVEELHLDDIDSWLQDDGDPTPEASDIEMTFQLTELRVVSVEECVISTLRSLFSHLRIPHRAKLLLRPATHELRRNIYSIFIINPETTLPYFENLARIHSLSLDNSGAHSQHFMSAHDAHGSQLLHIQPLDMLASCRLDIFSFSRLVQELSITGKQDNYFDCDWTYALWSLPSLQRIVIRDMKPTRILRILMAPSIGATVACEQLEEIVLSASGDWRCMNLRYNSHPECIVRELLLCAEIRHTRRRFPLRRVQVEAEYEDVDADARDVLLQALLAHVEVVELY